MFGRGWAGSTFALVMIAMPLQFKASIWSDSNASKSTEAWFQCGWPGSVRSYSPAEAFEVFGTHVAGSDLTMFCNEAHGTREIRIGFMLTGAMLLLLFVAVWPRPRWRWPGISFATLLVVLPIITPIQSSYRW